MPLGNDPTPLAELEAGFGTVTATAEQLISHNATMHSRQALAAGLKPVNDDLTEHVQDNLDKLEDYLGDTEVANVHVHGSGAGAMIQYVYVDDRDAHVKGHVPFAEVFGNSQLKRRAKAQRVRATNPDEAAEEAAAEERATMQQDAADALADARREAEELLEKARAQAEETMADARAEVERIQAEGAEDVQDAADKARAEQEKAEAKQSSAAKPSAPRAAAKK